MARGRQRIIRREVVRRLRNQLIDDQLQALIAYMEQHLWFARGQITKIGPQGHVKYQNMWLNLANLLNNIGPSVRNVLGWQRLWTKLRLKAKKEKATFLTALQRTGHNALEKELSRTDERISSIYGKYGTGIHLGQELGIKLIPDSDNQSSSVCLHELTQVMLCLQWAIDNTPIIIDQGFKNFKISMVDFHCNRPNRGGRPSDAQMDYMIGFMQRHQEAANMNNCKKPSIIPLWQQLVTDINAIEGGCFKQIAGWKKTWNDLVGTARQNMEFLLEGLRTTPLCSNHLKVIDIVGIRPPPDTEDPEDIPPTRAPSHRPTFCGYR